MELKINYLKENPDCKISLLNNEDILKINTDIPKEIGYVKSGDNIFIRLEDTIPKWDHIKGREIVENVIETIIKYEILKNPNTKYVFTERFTNNDLKNIFIIFKGITNALRYNNDIEEGKTPSNLFLDPSVEKIMPKIKKIWRFEYDFGALLNKNQTMIDSILKNDKYNFYNTLSKNSENIMVKEFIDKYNNLSSENGRFGVIDPELSNCYDTTWADHTHDEDMRKWYLSKKDFGVYIQEMYNEAHKEEENAINVTLSDSNNPFFYYDILTKNGGKIPVSIAFNEITSKDKKLIDYIKVKVTSDRKKNTRKTPSK